MRVSDQTNKWHWGLQFPACPELPRPPPSLPYLVHPQLVSSERGASQGALRFKLLHDLWVAGVPRRRAVTLAQAGSGGA